VTIHFDDPMSVKKAYRRKASVKDDLYRDMKPWRTGGEHLHMKMEKKAPKMEYMKEKPMEHKKPK